jgi:hypothetical protein
MFPPIVQWMASLPAPVLGYLKPSTVMRVFQDEKPQEQPAGDYVVYSMVYGAPEKSLSCKPSIDKLRIQFDVYSADRIRCQQIAAAVRDVLEDHGNVDYLASMRDPDTRDYRMILELSYWQHR